MNKIDKKRREEILNACKTAINSGINIIKQSVGRADGGFRSRYRKTAHPLYALLLNTENFDTSKFFPKRKRSIKWARTKFVYTGFDADYVSFKSIFDKLKKIKRIPISWMVGFDYGLNFSYYKIKKSEVNHKQILESMTYHVYKNHYGLTKKEILSWTKSNRELSLFKRGFIIGELVSEDIKDPSLKDNRAKKTLRSAIKSALKAKISEEEINLILNDCLVEDVLSS